MIVGVLKGGAILVDGDVDILITVAVDDVGKDGGRLGWQDETALKIRLHVGLAIAHQLVGIAGDIHNHVGLDVPEDTGELGVHVIVAHGKKRVADACGDVLGRKAELLHVIGIGGLLGKLIAIECHGIIETIQIGYLHGHVLVIDFKGQRGVGQFLEGIDGALHIEGKFAGAFHILHLDVSGQACLHVAAGNHQTVALQFKQEIVKNRIGVLAAHHFAHSIQTSEQ